MSHAKRTKPVEHYPMRLGAKGRVVVPAAVRRRLKLKAGQLLTLTIDERDPQGVARITNVAGEVGLLRERLGRRKLD